HRTIGIRKDPAAPPITGLVDYAALCGGPSLADVPEESVDRLAELLAAQGERSRSFELVDVREPGEWEIARIPGARLVPLGEFGGAHGDPLADLPSDRPVIVYCKAGGRSAQAAELLRDAGHTDVRSLAGGIDRWAHAIDPAMPRY